MTHDYILVADDDPGMHTLMGLVLRPLDVDVRFALNGNDVLDMVASNRPRLILLDLAMPNLDGFGVLDRLKEADETADIPIMILSANTFLAERMQYSWPAQVIEVLEKANVRPSRLRDLVKDQLAH